MIDQVEVLQIAEALTRFGFNSWHHKNDGIHAKAFTNNPDEIMDNMGSFAME